MRAPSSSLTIALSELFMNFAAAILIYSQPECKLKWPVSLGDSLAYTLWLTLCTLASHSKVFLSVTLSENQFNLMVPQMTRLSLSSGADE